MINELCLFPMYVCLPVTFHSNTYNHGPNILRLFDVRPNFLFTTSETKLSANICLGEDVLKTSSVTFFLSSKTSSRRLQDIIARPLFEDVLKKRWKRPGRKKMLHWRRFEDVLQTRLQYILKTSWRSLGKQEIFDEMIINNKHGI